MNESLWNALCACYGLGNSLGIPQTVSGGLQHRLYRAEATSGAYAVKVLSALLLREPGRRERCEQGEQIAQTASCAGLPVVTALPGTMGAIQNIGEAACLVFPWRAGMILPPDAAGTNTAHQIGVLLGRLHALDIPIPGSAAPPVSEHSDTEWINLVTEARKEYIPWAEVAAPVLPNLFLWSQTAQTALKALGRNFVATHRDMDQKNVLWSDPQSPWLLDWEDAGPMNPVLEVMGTALNWAGQAAGSPKHAPFAAFLAGYRETMPLSSELLRQAAVAVLDKWLVWLKFNMRRSLQSAAATPEERGMACGATFHALTTLAMLDKETPRRLYWCD